MTQNESEDTGHGEKSFCDIHERTSLLYQDISTTLKQWKILHTVAHCGSFASAAEFLCVSQATVSYALTQLEETLGISLLKLNGRKHQLTPSGHLLLRRSRALLATAVVLEKYAFALRTGTKPELRLAIARNFPTRIVIPALRRFSAIPANPKVLVMENSSTEVERFISDNDVDLALTTKVPDGFVGEEFAQIEYIPVISHDHPLARSSDLLQTDDLAAHVHIICHSTDEGNETLQKYTTQSMNNWYVSNVETAIAAICESVGYGWVPAHHVRDALWRGHLKPLPLAGSGKFTVNFYIVRGRATSLVSDVNRIVEVLHSAFEPLKQRARCHRPLSARPE